MNPEADKKLQELLVKGFQDENSLTEEEMAFIRARATYVKARHQARLPKTFSTKKGSK